MRIFLRRFRRLSRRALTFWESDFAVLTLLNQIRSPLEEEKYQQPDKEHLKDIGIAFFDCASWLPKSKRSSQSPKKKAVPEGIAPCRVPLLPSQEGTPSVRAARLESRKALGVIPVLRWKSRWKKLVFSYPTAAAMSSTESSVSVRRNCA